MSSRLDTRTRRDRCIRYTPAGWMLVATIWLTLTTAPVLLARDPWSAVTTLSGFLAFTLCLYSAARIAHVAGRDVMHPFEVMTWPFVYAMFGLAAFLQIDAQVFPLVQHVGGNYPATVQVEAMVIIWIGLASYEIGRLTLGRRSRASEIVPRQPRGQTGLRLRFSIQRAHVVIFGVLIFSAYAFFVRVGPAAFLASRSEFDGGSSLWLRGPIIAAAILVVLIMRQTDRSWTSLTVSIRALYTVTVLAALVINNPFVTARQWTGALLAGLVVAAARPHQRHIARLLVIGLALSLLVVYPFMNEFRIGGEDNDPLKYPGFTESIIRTHDYSMYSQIQSSVAYVDEFGHTDGRQLAAAVLFFVPRSVWHEKAFDTGDVVHHSLGMEERFNISSPLWMEFYVDGGLFLVSAGFFLVGVLTRRGDTAYVQGFGRPLSLTRAFTAIIAAFWTIVLRGALLPVAGRVALPLLVVVACFDWRSITRRRRPVSPDLATADPGSQGLSATPHQSGHTTGVPPCMC